MAIEDLKWPESCLYIGEKIAEMGHTHYECKHPMNEYGCYPDACPLKKLEKLEEDLQRYLEKQPTCTEEEIPWYRDQIDWTEKEIAKYLEC